MVAFSEQYDEIESAYCALTKQPSDATTEDGASSTQSKTHELQRRQLRVWLDEEIGKEHVQNSSTDRKTRGRSDVGTTPMNISRGPVDAHPNGGLKVEKGEVDTGSIAGEDGPKNAQFGDKDIPGEGFGHLSTLHSN